jgi:hypothetical protein
MITRIPPLPPDWPYPLRPGAAATELRAGVALPGLPGVWNLEAVTGLDLDRPDGAPLADAFGRGGVLRAGEVVLRPYRRGGLVRHFNPAIYLGPGRFRQEFLVHRVLWAAGAPTVEPLGWAYRRRSWGWEGVFLTRFEPGASWPHDWPRAGALARIAELLRALSAWGLHAPDLNATNFLLPEAGGLVALDWDGAHWTNPNGLLERYRARLLRSLRKLGAPGPVLDSINDRNGPFS